MVPRQLDGQVVSTAFCVLRADPAQVDPGFLYYSVLADEFTDRLANSQRGASYPAITDGDVLKEEILVPPLREQGAIAAVLAKIQAAVEVQERIVATLRELKAATMAKLFREGLRGEPLKQTEIGEIPESWEVVRLGDIAALITKGSSPKWQGFDYSHAGVLFVRSQNVELGDVALSEVAYLPAEFNRKERRSVLRHGDILVNIVGASIGRAAVADSRLDGANINQAVALVRLPPDTHNPVFLVHFLISRAGLSQMHRQKKEIARANLSLEDVGSLLVPIPRREEQDATAASLTSLGSKISLGKRKGEALGSLFSSMLHLLMTGKIRLPAFGRKPNLDSPWFKPEDVWAFVGRLVRKFDPEKVILFGSRAWGTPRRDGDVDLLVVMEFEGRPVDMAVRIGAECDDRFPMDLIVRRPAEVERRIAMGDPFFRQILRDGLVLHERAA